MNILKNSVTTVVRQSLEESIESILTTKTSIDILRNVQEYKQLHKTYRYHYSLFLTHSF